MGRTLILGVGNMLQKDDGIGVFVVNHLLESGIELPEGVDLGGRRIIRHKMITIM